MIALENHSVTYDAVTALDKISLQIADGEKIAVIGPSGAGKSTLLRELYGIFEGRASLIHQQLALVPQLKVFHNVYMGRLDANSIFRNLRNLAFPHREDQEKILPSLESLGIADLMWRRVSKLSGGEQQRVAIARALYSDANCILGDEPVSAIDPENSERVLGMLTELSHTVVLSMHDVELALKFCPRIVGLRHGRVVFDLPREAVGDKELLSLYALC